MARFLLLLGAAFAAGWLLSASRKQDVAARPGWHRSAAYNRPTFSRDSEAGWSEAGW